jgi:hypothetical protein
MPGFKLGEIPLMVPVDLIEGGFLQVVVGENPLVPATPSIELPKGCMLALILPEYAIHLRPGLELAVAQMRNPHIILPH